MPSVIYQIKDWNANFENNKSRERDQCSYVCVPNKQHGMGLTYILSQPDGLAIYGIWQLMVGAASRQKKQRDGWLTDNGHQTGTAWTPTDMAILWRCQEVIILRAIEVLSNPRVGWLLIVKTSDPTEKTTLEGQQVPAECPPSALEENRIEEKGNPPIVPQGGQGEGEKKVKKASSNIPTCEPAIRIATLYRRRLTTAWGDKEVKAFKKLQPIDMEELSLVEEYVASEREKEARGEKAIHRKDLQTFLNNYRGEVDRAREWKRLQSENTVVAFRPDDKINSLAGIRMVQ